MEKQILKRILAWLLTFAMVSSMFPVTAFAEEASKSAECIHSHDEFCGYVAAVEEVPCDKECTDTDGDGLIDHAEECAYTPAVQGQPCTHVHDESCGGVIVKQSEKDIEAEAPTEDTSDREESLLELIALLNELPDPMAYLADGTAKESILDGDQLAQARAAVDSWFAGEEEASSGSVEEREELQSLIVCLEGLEHIRDTETDCLDVDCPYHYPEIIQQQMAQDETPELLTLDDLVEEYGVEPPMQTFSRLRSASVPHPQTRMLTEDNENNSHTGSSDGDIDVLMRNEKGTHPIEVSFTLGEDELPTQSAYLAVKAYDVDEESGETDYVYINDDIFLKKDQENRYKHKYNDNTIGYLSGTDNTWNTTILKIPLEKLKVGKNTISVTIASGWFVKVDWMQLVLDGGATDPMIEEYSLKLENSATLGNNVTVQSSVTLKQTGKQQYTTEYTLTQNKTGNALDACFGTVLASETIELSMPLNSPTGIYTITGLLKDSTTEAIKATDSISFYFLQNVGLGPKISHTLTPDTLTNQDVKINVSAAELPEAGITNINISDNPKTVPENGTYSFTVNYTLNGNSQSVTYPVKVDNIDKQAPVIEYSTIAVSQGEEYETVKELFADNLSVSDNGTLASVPLSYTIPQDISNTSGAKTIVVTASDAAGNTTTQDCTITVLAKPVKLTMGTPAQVSGSKDSYTLNAVLDNGSDQITETGFVWGVMPNPTLELNNGSVKILPVIQETGKSLTGTAKGLLSGVEYNARAYAKVTENGNTNVVYSEARQFGFGIPQYGTFSVSSVSDSTFTITRTGGTDGAQTVYYRTVNGSAIGGTHFTHQAGTLTFADGEISKTVTVAELSVTSAYNSDAGTQYSNADRTYSLEIYRVEGGGAIDQENRSKIRTMAKNCYYTIDRSFYNDLIQNGDVAQQQKHIQDRTSKQGANNQSVNFTDVNRKGEKNWNRQIGVASLYGNSVKSYLDETNGYWLYRFAITGHGTSNQGYQDVWFGYQQPPTGNLTLNNATTPSSLPGQIWFDIFDFTESGCKAKVLGNTSLVQSISTVQDAYSTVDPKGYAKNDGLVVSYNGSNYGKLEVTQDAWVCFSAHGQGEDDWYIIRYQEEAILQDANEPTLLGVAPMAGGTYLPGDPITVALVFDEIVDKQNSTLGSVSINTNVGTLTYAGGADTNVLYFTGTVASTTGNLNGDNALTVTAINNSRYIKDMCSTAGTTSTSTTGFSNVTVDATKPTVTITANTSGSLPQHKATITATNANTLQYAWTQSTALPAYGWSNVTSRTQLTESRGTAGATETWYLHVLATSSAGATTHECKGFSFMQPNITSVSVRAGESSTSEDVTDAWKPSKYIVVTYAGAQTSGTTLTFAGPETSSQTITTESGTKSLQVTNNGTYTVTLTDGYGSVISKTIEVKKIDADKPTVTLRSGNSTDGNTVYNSLSIAVLPADAGGSGLAKVEYAWTNTATEPTTWNTLTAASDGSYQAAYTATKTTKTTKYLHVKVTDGAGNVSSVATSGPYQVIQAATGAALPTITVTGNPTAWTKSATLTWTATAGTGTGAGTIQTVYTPDSTVTNATTGSCTVTKNGIYQFVVIDANGNSAAAEVNVTNVDSEAPKLTSLTAQAGHTNGTITLTGVTDNCTVIYDNNGNISSYSGSGLQSGRYRLESESTWTTFTGDSITVSKNGTYIVKLTDNLGNSREYSVKMEGIDATIKYTVTFNANGHGTAPAPQTVAYGGKATEPDALTATGYVFGGWYEEAGCINKWVFSTDTVTSSITLYAKWTLVAGTSYKVNHYTEDLTDNTWTLQETENKTGTTGTALTLADLAKSITGFTYKEGKAGGSVVTSTTILADGSREIDLYYTRDAYTLTLNQGTGISDVSGLGSYKYGQSVSVNATVSAGYTWKNWTGTNTSTDQKFSFTMPASNVTLTANATINQYTVTFNANGHGTAPASQTVAYGGKATEPDALTATGYVFGGWYTDAACTDGKQFDFANTQVKANITLYAKWTLAKPSVTLTVVGGTTNSGVVNAVYNNGATVLTLKAELSNRADSASGIHYTYAWYKGGVQLDIADESLILKTVDQSGSYKVEVTAHGAGQTATKASVEITVSIAKATPEVTVKPTASDITYGNSLSRSSLTGGEAKVASTTVAGSFAWEAPGSMPAVSDSNATPYTVVFTPEDTTNYRSVTTTLTLKVNPKPITAVWTKLTAAYNGTAQAPECSTLVGLMEADAEDVFADFTAEQRLTNAGTKRLTAVLGGDRADNYRLTNPHVNFTVQKAPVTFAVEDNVVPADGHAHKATVSAYANGAALDASNYAITYRNAAGQTVQEPVNAGTYGIYAELKNPNYRHSGTAETAARQIGVLTIYQNQTAKTYTVEYAKGASEVTGDLPTSQTGVSEGTLIYLPEKGTLSRTGYAFTGWLLNGKLYQPGETFTMPANNVTITACWKEATYRISGVVDQERKPLPHAVVTLKRGAEIIGETTTDTEGKYSFVGVIPGLYNLITSYDGITTTVKVLIVDTDAEQNATLPAGRTNSILEVVAGAPAVIVGNLEKLFQISEGSNSPAYPEIYTDNDKNVVETGGTVEIRLTVEKVAEPDPTGAELLKEAMQKLPEAFDYQPELYLDLVLQKTVYPAEGSGSGSAVTKTLADSHVILESVISLPSNLQSRRFYKVYRIHQNEQGDILLQELTTQPNAEGEYYELNPENTELTIHARKYSVYTVAASDYVAPQPANPESSGGAEGHPDNGAPEEEKVENSQVNQKPLEAAQKLPVKRDPETEKTEESPEAIPTENPEEIPTEIPQAPLPEQEQREEPMPVGRNGKSFVVLNVLLTLLSLVMAVRLLLGSQERRRKIAGLTAAAASLLLLLLTLGFGGVRIADLRTILFTLLAAITVFMNLTGTKQDKEKSML